jgi:cytochrome d ubiquinol oxidase subunit I
MTRFWTGVFAVNFAVGVATGLVMEFEFGTNWASYSRYVGDIFGSALAAEGIFAFFLESGFLAVLVFGWDRVSPRMHFFATTMVALGSIFSAIWIVIANSWMQTPAGYHIVGEGLQARAEITDFWAMVFNPSSAVRLAHVLVGAFNTGAFFVMSVAAFYLLTGRHVDFARKTFALALVWGTIVSLAALATGHLSAEEVAQNQPAKLATLEGHFETGPADMHAFGIPNAATGRVEYGLPLPGLLSLLVHGDPQAPVTGLNAFPPEDRPPLQIPFQMFHLMVAIGMSQIGLTMLGAFLLWRGALFRQRWLLKLFVGAVLGPVIANEAGWMSAEVGRQPWIVYGLLRTSDAVSKAVVAEQIAISIVMFLVIYLLLFAVWVYVLHSKIQHGPDAVGDLPSETTPAGLVQAAARRASQGGYSLTLAHQPGTDAPSSPDGPRREAD